MLLLEILGGSFNGGEAEWLIDRVWLEEIFQEFSLGAKFLLLVLLLLDGHGSNGEWETLAEQFFLLILSSEALLNHNVIHEFVHSWLRELLFGKVNKVLLHTWLSFLLHGQVVQELSERLLWLLSLLSHQVDESVMHGWLGSLIHIVEEAHELWFLFLLNEHVGHQVSEGWLGLLSLSLLKVQVDKSVMHRWLFKFLLSHIVEQVHKFHSILFISLL